MGYSEAVKWGIVKLLIIAIEFNITVKAAFLCKYSASRMNLSFDLLTFLKSKTT